MSKRRSLTRFAIAAAALIAISAITYAATSDNSSPFMASVREFFGIAPVQTMDLSSQPETAIAIPTPKPLAPLAPILWANIGTDFNTAANWGGGTLPGTADIATFTGAASVQPNVSSNITVSGVNFSSNVSGGYDLTSSSTATKLSLNSLVSTAGLQAIQSLATSGTNTIDSPLVLNGAAASTQTFLQSSGGTLTLNGVISSTNSVTLSLSSTGTFNLNGANNYTGTTSWVNTTSTTSIGNASAFGTSTVSLIGTTIKAGTDLTGANKITNAITLGGSPTIANSGAFGIQFNGNVNMGASNRTITSAISGGSTFDGIISNGNTLTVTTQNSSLVTLTNASNSFTGFTTSGTGRVSVAFFGNAGANGNLGTGTINLGSTTSAGTLLYTGSGETTDKIINLNGTTGGATIDQSGTGLLKFTVLATTPGAGSKTFTLQGSTAGTGEIAGVINSNSGGNPTSLTKTGSSSWILSGANNYTGATTINAGTLFVTGSTAPETTVTVSGTGILGGTGTILGPVIVNSGGKLAPGLSPGILNIGNAGNPSSVTFSSGSTFAVEIGGTTPGNAATNHDQLNVTGSVSPNGATLSLASVGGFTPAGGQTFTIINNDGADAITTTFAGLSEGATISNFLGSSLSATISYAGGSGNDVVITVLAGTPTITVDTTGFTGNFGDVFVGTDSAEQQYKVSGTNIGAGGIIVTAPAGFQISPASGFGFGSSFTIIGAGTIPPTDVFVRFHPTASGPASGNITNVSTGATTVNVPVTGNGTLPGTIQFDHATYSQDEFGGTASITVERVGGTGGPVSVNFATSNGTATAGTCGTAGVDYVSSSGTLTFNGTESSKTFTVPICNDSLFEPVSPETVNLTLSGPTNGATLGSQTTAVLNIIEDDIQPSIQLSSATYSVGEGGGTATITVTRTNATENAVSVNFNTSNGTATGGTCGAFSGNDYVPASGTLNFASGDTSKPFDITICDDSLFESSETVNIALNTFVGATIGIPNTAVLTINENDTAPTVQFSAASVSVGEGAGTITLTATRTGATENSFTVNFQTADGTAIAGPCGSGGDYNSTSGTLSFAGGDPSKTFDVTICDDTLFEGNEDFTATLVTPSSPAVLGTNSTETVTITDNDSSPSIQFSSAFYSGPEGSNVTVTVTRTGDTSGTSTVNYATVAGGTATGGVCGTLAKDFAPASGTLTFNPTDTSQTFDITLCSDFTTENPAETVNLLLSSPSNATLGGQSASVLSILDAATQFRSVVPITVPFNTIANPYSTSITVTSYPGPIGGIRVTLFGVTDVTPDNLEALLVSPNGAAFVMMADTGDGVALNNGTITLEDAATVYLPDGLPGIADGINYRPASCGTAGPFPAPAPAVFVSPGCGPSGPTLSGSFGGVPADGVWTLYVRNDGGAALIGDPDGSIGGWGLQILIPTAAQATISGQVRTANGVGIRNAVVTVSGGNLPQPITAYTGSFGYYSVPGLTAGQAYVVSVSTRRYRFTNPVRVVQLFEDVAGFDFVADP